MPFLKLDKSILGSSLWHGGRPDEILVWIYLLLKADSGRGFVDETIPSIAVNCHISQERCWEILEMLSAEDQYSRSPENGGRRIRIHREPEWSIEVLNWHKYSQKDHTAAARQRKLRAKREGVAK